VRAPGMAYRVVSTDAKTRGALEDAFTWEGADVSVEHVDVRTPTEVSAAAEGADALVVDAVTPVTGEVLRRPGLKVVARAGSGLDNVDLAAARRAGVVVTNDPDYCVDEVATHALSLLLATWRQLRPYDREVRDGGWSRETGAPVRRLGGRTLGLVAFGAIPRRLADLVSGFDLDVLAYDPYVDPEEMAEYGVQRVGAETLFSESDLLSVHAPLTEETRGLVDASALARLPPHAVVVNTGRGAVVDGDALEAALRRGEIAGAGLDVFEEEPPMDLPDGENVLLTPHVGWYSESAIRENAETVAADVAAVLLGREPENAVTEGK